MKTILTIEQEFDIKTIHVQAGVRYWEDGKINGVEDLEGNMPFKKGELWDLKIDIDSGTIIDWPQGIEADVHYKVCDAGSYYLIDDTGATVMAIEQDYVPHGVIPGDYGDYIIMKIDGTGKVLNWPKKISFEDFHED